MAESLKKAVHQLVEECNDTQSLQDVHTLLKAANNGEDWWNTLSTAQQEKTLISIDQAKAGKVISHEEVSKRIWKKIYQ
jgi:predicted transcriptional regulator